MRNVLGLLLGVCLLGSAFPVLGQEPEHPRQKEIDQAIQKGVAYLKSIQQGGIFPYAAYTPGSTALGAWTLLESGVPKDDPAIQNAAKYLRDASIKEYQTYNASLQLIFFDRLGEARDIPLIESLAVRLLQGQSTTGGWTYTSAAINQQEQERLKKWLKDVEKEPELADKLEKGVDRKIHPSIAQQINALQGRDPGEISGISGDNSNTQFAMIALWISHNYGIPVTDAMNKVGKRFRTSQASDGQWRYEFSINPPLAGIDGNSPAMSCAGSLGLALGYAVDPKDADKDLLKDAQVRKGFAFLRRALKNPGGPNTLNGRRIYYFVWSLERAAVVYNIQAIEDMDWYDWGVDFLLASQGKDGSWHGEFDVAGCDTCFALLFLNRVNVVEDLTQKVAKTELPKKETEPVKTTDPKKDPFKNLVPVVPGNKNKPKKEAPKPLFPKKTSSFSRTWERTIRSYAFSRSIYAEWQPRGMGRELRLG